MQTQAGPIGPVVDGVRAALSWLGGCKRQHAGHSMHLVFPFTPETEAEATLKLRVEINTREHGSLLGIRKYPYAVDSEWYRGRAEIASFEPEELFGTKLRALLQRRKNRDLFDLNEGLRQLSMDTRKILACFSHALTLEGRPLTRAVAEQRMLEKLTRSLTEDIAPLLPAGVRFDEDSARQAWERVWKDLVTKLKGDAWKLTGQVLESLRERSFPGLLLDR